MKRCAQVLQEEEGKAKQRKIAVASEIDDAWKKSLTELQSVTTTLEKLIEKQKANKLEYPEWVTVLQRVVENHPTPYLYPMDQNTELEKYCMMDEVEVKVPFRFQLGGYKFKEVVNVEVDTCGELEFPDYDENDEKPELKNIEYDAEAIFKYAEKFEPDCDRNAVDIDFKNGNDQWGETFHDIKISRWRLAPI